MKKINDGGPAFPLGANEYAGHGPCWGMSLRDYFAAKAMAALIVADDVGDFQSVAEYIEETASGAYLYADAMLRAREAS